MNVDGYTRQTEAAKCISRTWYIHADYMHNVAPRTQQNSARYVCLFISLISLSLFPSLSLEIILVDLIRHHHHPQQKHRPNDIKCERRLPILTYPLRLQPRQRRLPVRQARNRPVEIAVAVYGARGPVELDGGFDQAGEEEHEKDEGAEDDDAREQLPSLD